MNINATIIGQFITFAIFVWFTMRYVWPPIVKAMEDRKQQIADGLAAAERGAHELELAQHKAGDLLRDAKIQASQIVDEASKRGSYLIEEAKDRAREEGQRIIELGKSEIDKEVQKAKTDLKEQVALIALQGAEKILEHNIDKAENSKLIDKLITEI